MSEREPCLLIEDMLESALKIITYTENFTYQQFINDDKTIDAVIRNFEIIGEAANKLPTEFKLNHDNIYLKQIKGFRNRIVHDYFGVDYRIVRERKENFSPELILELKKI